MITVVVLDDCSQCAFYGDKTNDTCYCYLFINYMCKNCYVSRYNGYIINLKDISREEVESYIALFSIQHNIHFNQVVVKIRVEDSDD